jgi:hypothetical protein
MTKEHLIKSLKLIPGNPDIFVRIMRRNEPLDQTTVFSLCTTTNNNPEYFILVDLTNQLRAENEENPEELNPEPNAKQVNPFDLL